MPSSSSSSGAAASAAGRRIELLRRVHELALGNWEKLLTQPVAEEAFKKAFRAGLLKYPDAAKAVASGSSSSGMLHLVMQREFSTLARDMPEAFALLAKDVVANFAGAARSEFEVIVRERGLEEKLTELERLEEAMRRAKEDKDADRPLPLPLAPEEEMRSLAVEAKLAYEQALLREQERVRRALSLSPLACTWVFSAANTHSHSLTHTHTHTPLSPMRTSMPMA